MLPFIPGNPLNPGSPAWPAVHIGLSQALVGALLRDLDTWLESEEEPPPPLNRHNQEGTTKAHVGNPHYGSEAYQELNLHPEILALVNRKYCLAISVY